MNSIRNLHELNTAIARRADTQGTHITAAETARVLRSLWQVLAQLPPGQILRLISRGLTTASDQSSTPE